MAAFAIPRRVGVRDVEIWVAWWTDAPRPPLDLVLLRDDRREVARRTLPGRWRVVGRRSDGVPACRFRSETFTGLSGNTRFFCYLEDRNTGVHVASGSFETLPIQLVPTTEGSSARDRRPFTLFLGSCFWDEDDDGEVAAAYRQLYASARHCPHVKLLVGDQVYVDQPPSSWADPFVSNEAIRQRVTIRYHQVWHRLQQLLEGGANVFTSDDHEFWNDYPFRPLRIWLALQDAATRRYLGRITRQFADEVQGLQPTHTFSVGDQLSVLVADTRRWRTETEFMPEADLAAVEAWIADLQSPGVLVVGQPLLWEPFGHVEVDTGSAWNWVGALVGAMAGGIPGAVAGALAPEAAEELAERGAGRISDRNLMYYKAQYRRLVRALSRSRHDILVLSGDIHLGRVARFKIHNHEGRDPTKVYEVVASPMTVLSTGPLPTQDVDDQAKNPVWFPPDLRLLDPTVIPARVDYPRHIPPGSGQPTPDHFMTLAFTAGTEPGSVDVTVRAWMIREPPSSPRLPRRGWTYRFTLDGGRLPADGSRPDRVVTHTITNPDGDIMALANPNASWSPRLRHEAIRDLDQGLARYYTSSRRSTTARLHVVHDRARGIDYLRTNADRASRNNLDNLPRLPWGDWHDQRHEPLGNE